MKVWKGKEKEGILKGIETLFIGDYSVGIDTIEKYVDKYDNIQQLYFGAGGCTFVNIIVLKKVLNKYKNLIITVECYLDDLHQFEHLNDKRLGFMVTIKNDNITLLQKRLKNHTQIKLQSLDTTNKVLYTIPFELFERVNISTLMGKKYKGDVILE